MKTLTCASMAIVGVVLVLQNAIADEDRLRWEEVVGIIQAGNIVGSGSGQVAGGGQPWSVTDGNASVDLRTARIKFNVRGLVLAGGNGIGTPGAITQVKGTLVCDTDGSAGGGNSTVIDTPPVTLSPEGDARFSGELGVLPSACATEPDIAFLVRIGPGRWIANGAVLRR
jgi:hypothetical protein